MSPEIFFSPSGATQLGGGVIAGIAVGYAAKRALKLALLLLGVCLLGLYALAQKGIITVHWDAVSQGLETGSRGLGAWFASMVTQLSPSLIGFGGGVAMGLRVR